jgi:hypothetical protein
MGATQDPKLAEETLDYILTKARDQDLHTFFRGLQSNLKTRRLLANFFMKQLDVVSTLQPDDILEYSHNQSQLHKRIEGYNLSYLVKVSSNINSTLDYVIFFRSTIVCS